jgi:amino acid permease
VLETAANIFTDIVPAGMLPVASGLAIASSSLPPAVAHPVAVGMVVFFAAIAHRTLVLVAEAIEASGVAEAGGVVQSLSELWASSPTLGGAKTVWLVDLSVALLTFGCCLYYVCFVGDLLSAAADGVLAPASPGQTQHNLTPSRRTAHILTATACALLPLCLLRDLSLLAPFSLVGVVACAYTAAFVLYRSLDHRRAA